MARPGVRRTLRNVSNNVNKRASILRFYRAALSVFDNAAGRARLVAKLPRGGGGALDAAPRVGIKSESERGGGGYFVGSSENATSSEGGGEDRSAAARERIANK